MKSDEQLCPRFQQAIDIIAKRWSPLIIKVLMAKALRFNEIAERLESVSDRMLSERLKDLEVENIVQRVVHCSTPVRVEYSLTEKGKALGPVIEEIERWSHEWIPLESASEAPPAVPTLET